MRPTRPLYFMLNLAGSGHDFRGVCFSVAYTTPNGKSCRTFPKPRSIYHNSRCTPPLKRPQSLSGAKKRKKTRKHQAKPEKCVRIVFSALHNYARKRCAIDFGCSEGRTSQNDKFSRLEYGVQPGDDFSALLQLRIFVILQKKARQDQPDTLCSCQMRIAGYCVSTPVSSAVDDGDTVPP